MDGNTGGRFDEISAFFLPAFFYTPECLSKRHPKNQLSFFFYIFTSYIKGNFDVIKLYFPHSLKHTI